MIILYCIGLFALHYVLFHFIHYINGDICMKYYMMMRSILVIVESYILLIMLYICIVDMFIRYVVFLECIFI